jgi:sulfiredoxin
VDAGAIQPELTAGKTAPSNGTVKTVLKTQTIAILDIYVPVKRRQTLDPKKVEAIAESMLSVGQQAPILVRSDGSRFVLVEGLHRLEACRALGEQTVIAYRVQARPH